MIKGTYKAGAKMPSYFRLTGIIIQSVSDEFGIPKFFIAFFATLIFISVIFGILYLVMRFQPR